MGGQRETTVPQKTKSKAGPSQTVGSVRIHEENGEVHFHDDANKLKVAMPVADWSIAWDKLSQGAKRKLKFYDVERKTLLRIRVKALSEKATDGAKKRKVLCAFITIEPFECSNEFAALQKFTKEA